MNSAGPGPQKPTEKVLEGIAFTYCKVATVALLCGRFALPVAAGLSAIFFIATYLKGQRETRCILGPPLFVALFWVLVLSFWIGLKLNPSWLTGIRSYFAI